MLQQKGPKTYCYFSVSFVLGNKCQKQNNVKLSSYYAPPLCIPETVRALLLKPRNISLYWHETICRHQQNDSLGGQNHKIT